MTNRSRQLRHLQQANAEVDLVMAIHEQASRVYHDTLVAMGKRPAAKSSLNASTDVQIALGADLRSVSLTSESREKNRGRT